MTAHPIFASVLCGTHNDANGYAARRQAALLVSPGGAVELVSAMALMRQTSEELQDRCSGHDLLVIADGPGARRTLEYAPIPVLLARWCPTGAGDVTRSILVAVEDRAASEEIADLAGRLAGRYGGSVTLLAAPRHNLALERALNAGERIVLQRTGAAPKVLGEHLPLEQTIAARCASAAATLLVLGIGDAGIARRTAADIAARVGCSVLAVPVRAPAPGSVASAERRRELVPA
jgi:nucleotide-binding universal stress UspA family protein